ncbi:PTS ascorbate transporter subunit IIB [Pullulanibacillus camelliae]|uniref:PTS ascorbate transporter subunit IIB n=1 Tax=Pullulanibacillus camelliae TaxID=1707096 RepID=A0A8J2YMC5_9BACL|nr:PTS sugar transporter subunit IIB [Pullulanibacillus camelliae]GGE53308.1 PTS ascorbate transporter subunit IIB [Pullulanibacillus camelliae]
MKILCVCGLGQGTSLILRMNVDTVLRQMGVQADVENTDVSSASSERPDLIITSNELAESLAGHPSTIVIVNNYFDLNEIKEALESHFS